MISINRFLKKYEYKILNIIGSLNCTIDTLQCLFPEEPILSITSNQVCEGDMGILTATVVSCNSTYQWQILNVDEWEDIPGETGLTLHVEIVDDTIEYRLAITQCNGNIVYSESHSFTTVDPEVIISYNDEYVCRNTNFTLYSEVTNGAGITYQWQREIASVWTDIIGETNSTYVANFNNGIYLFRVIINEGTFCEAISNELEVTVEACVANITGSVIDEFGDPIPGSNVRLFRDVNQDGISDGGINTRSVFTNSSGTYAMASLEYGDYVIVNTPPAGFSLISGIDSSDDSDTVPNTITTDNIIPVTLSHSEGLIDYDNKFIWRPLPGKITGYVFIDADADQTPDAGEGFVGATVELYEDASIDGVPEGLIDTTITDANGFYQFLNIATNTYAGRKRHCVLKLIVPDGYQIVKGYDLTNDGDAVTNTPDTDIYIPVTVNQNETDANNYFTIELIP